MHLISERVAAGLEVNPGKMGKKDLASTHLCSSETSQSAPRSTKKALFGGSPDANILHPRKGVGGLKCCLKHDRLTFSIEPRPREMVPYPSSRHDSAQYCTATSRSNGNVQYVHY